MGQCIWQPRMDMKACYIKGTNGITIVTNTMVVLLLDLCKALSDPSPQNPTMLAVLNCQNKAGNTALHWAALNGHLPAVKVLLENGAGKPFTINYKKCTLGLTLSVDPTITNHRGHDAIYEAELNDKTDVVKWVLEEGGKSHVFSSSSCRITLWLFWLTEL